MIDRLPELVNDDAVLVRRGRFVSTTFLIGVSDAEWRLRIDAGRIAEVIRHVSPMAAFSFAVRAAEPEWQLFWRPIPPPGSQDIFAMLKRRVLRAEGDLHPLWSNMFYFKGVLAAPRKLVRAA